MAGAGVKILAVGSHILADPNRQSQVDHWRIGRPMQELAKHTGWQIDHQPTFVPGFDKFKTREEFTAQELEKAFAKLCEYDIVFSSYHPDPTAYSMLKVAKNRAGVELVMDCDDDMFAINEDNPFWMKMSDEKVYWMQRMIADNDWITTPSPVLAERFRERRPEKQADSVAVIPNYIADVYRYEAFDNAPSLVIGYMGGASHYADLHQSGALEAIQKLMHEYKHIKFKCVGQLVDTYLPTQRVIKEPGKRGTAFFDEVFPKLHMDIAIGPLLDNQFNRGKSNIKWQEMTRAGSTFVASNIGPYTSLHDGVDALLVENDSDAWYAALKKLVERPALRRLLLANAQKDVRLNWKLENHWQMYQQLFERVKKIEHAPILARL